MLRKVSCFVPSLIPSVRYAADNLPDETARDWGSRVFALMNLAWDHIDTLCDICIQQRRDGTKPLVRRVREIRRDYDHFRHQVIGVDGDFDREETERAETFLEIFEDDFKRIFNAIDFEVAKLGLQRKEDHTLLIAVCQAMSVMKAVKLCASEFDKVADRYGLTPRSLCMVSDDFLKLYPLVPKFAGSLYSSDFPGLDLAAGIIRNRIMSIDIITQPPS